MSAVTLYREIDALGGADDRSWNLAIVQALEILERRGFSEMQDAVSVAPTPVFTFGADAKADNTIRLSIAQAIAKNCYAFGGPAIEGSERYDCGDWSGMGRLAQLVYIAAADAVLDALGKEAPHALTPP